jgi:hypothetical protein
VSVSPGVCSQVTWKGMMNNIFRVEDHFFYMDGNTGKKKNLLKCQGLFGKCFENNYFTSLGFCNIMTSHTWGFSSFFSSLNEEVWPRDVGFEYLCQH